MEDPLMAWMWVEQLFVGLVVVVVFVLLVREWLSPDLVAMGAFVVVLMAGVLKKEDAALVFGSGAPLIVACMFVLSAALERTGTIEALGHWFERMAGKSELRILLMLMLLVVPLSAFVNNTPVVVVLLPIVLKICRKQNLVASRFLIPLSYAAIAGGTCTIIGTSTNILAAEIAEEVGRERGVEGLMEPFGMFEVTKLGVVFAGVTILYLMLFGRKLLPDRVTLSTLFESEEGKEFLTQAVIAEGSALVGRNFTETGLAKMRELRLIEVRRDGERVEDSLKKVIFQSGDQLTLKSRASGVMGLNEVEGLMLGPKRELGLEKLKTETAVLMEGIVGPRSRLVGSSLKELNLRQRYGVLVLAVHRRGENLRDRFEDVRLAFGDTLLVEGPPAAMKKLFAERDFVNLSRPTARPFRRSKAPVAIGALALFMILGALNAFPLLALALMGVLLVTMTRTIDLNEAYEAIEWRVIFMIFGMLGLGRALEASGLAQEMSFAAVHAFGDYGKQVVLAVVYLLAAVLTEVISNNAVAALLTPIAIGVASDLGSDPRAFVVAVMFGASASFSTPIGYQTNTFVYGAGGYRFGDFARVGVPLALILWLLASLLIPVFWPL
ncbi:MAG: SLC13 family permease [Verrucomicrobiales bacterium]|nr:SLC13 family permease [Verrucomicrobiales bacterium]